MTKADLYLARATGFLLALSSLAYISLAPVYETGVWKVVVPLVSTLEFVVAFAILKNSPKLKPWARPLAIGSLLIAVPFWGQSREHYADLVVPMLVAETAFIVACASLLFLTWRPGFLIAQQAQQGAPGDAKKRRA